MYTRCPTYTTRRRSTLLPKTLCVAFSLSRTFSFVPLYPLAHVGDLDYRCGMQMRLPILNVSRLVKSCMLTLSNLQQKNHKRHTKAHKLYIAPDTSMCDLQPWVGFWSQFPHHCHGHHHHHDWPSGSEVGAGSQFGLLHRLLLLLLDQLLASLVPVWSVL